MPRHTQSAGGRRGLLGPRGCCGERASEQTVQAHITKRQRASRRGPFVSPVKLSRAWRQQALFQIDQSVFQSFADLPWILPTTNSFLALPGFFNPCAMRSFSQAWQTGLHGHHLSSHCTCLVEEAPPSEPS